MKIPLYQFEQFIDETILKRGLTYFRTGLVEDPEELSPGFFEAIVEGSESYRVTVTIQNETITDHSCTCPYDMGPVCKHIAALLFALQAETLGIKKQNKITAVKNSTEKTIKKGRKTVIEQVDEILTKLPPNHIADFIREQCIKDPAFRRLFIARFISLFEGESNAVYAQQVKAILNSAKGRHGFIEWNRAGSVGKAVYELLINARKQLEVKNYQTVLMISCAVLEEMFKALQFADDSDGDIGGSVSEAMEILFLVSEEELPEENRKWLFDYTLSAIKKRIYDGWDWDLDMFALAANLVKGEKEASILLELIESMAFSEYMEKHVQEIRVKALRKSGRKEEAEAFEAKHLNNPIFRGQAIKKSIASGDLDKAEQIAQEGIKQDKKDKPGLADDWVDWLLKIAQERNDRKMIITHARYLFDKANRDHKYYYRILKENIDPAEWPSFADELIHQLSDQRRWSDPHLVAWICIEEERWDILLTVCDRSFTINGVQEYEKHLAKHYPEELAAIYKRKILELLERSTGRNQYQEAARFIRRMKKIGAASQASELITFLKQKYPQRRALLEELGMI